MMAHCQGVASLRRHYEPLSGQDKNNYFDKPSPDDDFYGGFAQSTGLQYMIYLDNHSKGFTDVGMGLEIYQEHDFYEATQLLGLSDGLSQPHYQHRTGICYI